MPFHVSFTELNNTPLIHLSDNNHSTSVTILPRTGAMLHEFTIQVNGNPFNVIENYSLDRPVHEQVTNYYRSVKLSPWVCRLANGRYNFQGREYQADQMYSDGSALHGLLYNRRFTVVGHAENDDVASVTLEHVYIGLDNGYPFKYKCQVIYALRPNALLEVKTTVTNMSQQDIPIADGWHPYFRLGGRVDDWELHFNARSMVEFDDKLIPTGRLLPYHRFNHPSRIGDISMDNCFLLNVDENRPACILKNPANNISVSLMPDRTYPYLQVFIPNHRESIALENLSSAPDSFNNQMGLTVLSPGQSQTLRVFYKAGLE